MVYKFAFYRYAVIRESWKTVGNPPKVRPMPIVPARSGRNISSRIDLAKRIGATFGINVVISRIGITDAAMAIKLAQQI